MTHEAFYATIAQVMPVLLIAGTVEIGLFRPSDREDRTSTRYSILAILLIVLAEILALAMLGARSDNAVVRGVLTFAAGETLALLLIPIVGAYWIKVLGHHGEVGAQVRTLLISYVPMFASMAAAVYVAVA